VTRGTFLPLARTLAPIAAGLFFVAVAANLAQSGFAFARHKDAPALDPFAGFGRIFSGRSLVGLFFNTGKIILAATIAYLAVRSQWDALLALQGRPASQAFGVGLSIVYTVAIRVIGVLVAIGVLDYAWQRYVHERDLRMTRREVKEEMRRQEVDPATRRRRRGAAMAWSASRIQRDVATADVVLVDARDSAAVALKFDEQNMTAPRLLAKGRGATAQQIREAALQSAIPVVEQARLALAVAKAVAVGRDVPGRFHADLADVFAYTLSLRGEVS
jgi:flagellar biosynthetic protein FlhB